MSTAMKLLTATVLALPVAAHAQMATDQPIGYPVTGLYIGAAGGFNLKGNESIKNLSSNLRTLSTGLSTPNLNFSSNIGGAGIAGLGWGFGNGLRAEVEFDSRGNGISKLSGTTPGGFGASSKAGGTEQLWGPMFNVLYDFNGLSPYVVPYAGVGVGYQFNNWLRGDITGQYRGNSNFKGTDLITYATGTGGLVANGIDMQVISPSIMQQCRDAAEREADDGGVAPLDRGNERAARALHAVGTRFVDRLAGREVGADGVDAGLWGLRARRAIEIDDGPSVLLDG